MNRVMNRRTLVGAALIGAAVLLAGLGLVLWDANTLFEEAEPNRGPSYGAWAVGALLFLSGVIVMATTPPKN